MNANISANDFVTNANCTILNEFRVALFETYFLEHLIHYISVFERGAYIEQNWIKNVKCSYNDCRCTWSKAMLVTLNWPQSLQYVFVNFARICILKTISLISDTHSREEECNKVELHILFHTGITFEINVSDSNMGSYIHKIVTHL